MTPGAVLSVAELARMLGRKSAAPHHLGKVISLRDMIEFSLHVVFFCLTALEANCRELGDNTEPGVAIPQDHLSVYAKNVRAAVHACATLGVPQSCKAGEFLPLNLEDPETPWNALAVSQRIKALISQLLHECDSHKWVRIDARHAAYFQQPAKAFGEEVYGAFEGARDNIRDAGQALAVDLNTAAVFHAMRVAEHGLKWLGKRLKVTLRDNNKDLPVTEAEWHRIILGIQNKIKASRATTKSAKRREQLEQYARAADHCDYMREIWRNAVSHAHKSYNALEAENAVNRVREFMQLLASMV